MNDFRPPPRGMVAVPLDGAPPVDYFLMERPGASGKATSALRQLIVDTARSG